ncbi:twitch domain-containing radical SAM protein [candidate division CSSED10-310 bacterium]|uniref:Twitch domain-containing radical SAM protein n=1 Tax=candidate division CSSED10-310 bacterium TaxID=2855610 RepID=A0ABV6YR56_UNCC1
MNWETFRTELKLNETQLKPILDAIHHFKDQYTQLCMDPAENGGKSPIEYAAELHISFLHMMPDAFGKKFFSYFSQEKNSVFKMTYLEKGMQYESATRDKIYSILGADQIRILNTLELQSLLDITTGYDPFGDKLTEMISSIRKSMKKNGGHLFSETFCILPWVQTFVDVNGEIKLCCYSFEGLKIKGTETTLNFQELTLSEIWNSVEIREIRRLMLAGKKVQACSSCDQQADLGQEPPREAYNNKWLSGDPNHEKWKKRVQDSQQNNYFVSELPVLYDIRPGNICNFKCRMCHADYSILIKKDPVHSKWVHQSPDNTKSRFSDGIKWYDPRSAVIDELLENIQETKYFYFAGGEPLITPFIHKIIDELIERRMSQNIDLEFSTNLYFYDEKMIDKLNKFNYTKFMVSIDGFGPVYDYIRYPGKWSTIERNLHNIRRNPKSFYAIIATMQNYNVLSITALFRFAESLNLSFMVNLLRIPVYLNIRIMPRKAQLLAIQRLQEFMAGSPMVKKYPHTAATINNVILELEQDSEKLYRSTIEEFIFFTNDLDKSRQQSFKETVPELYNFIIEDGYSWTEQLGKSRLKNGWDPTRLNEDNI